MNKYILYVSVVLNGILLMAVTGVLPFLLYLSIIINLVLAWFSVKCIKDSSDVEEDLDEIMNKTDLFVNHLEDIYELEMFYGDETLMALIDHSKQLVNEFIELQVKYFDVDVVEEQEQQEEQEEQEGQDGREDDVAPA
tara:strand:+ start:3437 stop:3850 length:414 start_codon:yes stop_codon:yes gene_type:complete